MTLAGRLAAITGGARGIGLASARALAAAGAEVLLLDRDQGALEASAETLPNARRALIDCCDPQAAAAILDSEVKAHGGLDILINNAGRFAATPIGDVKPDEFATLYAVNAVAPFFLARAARPHMIARGGGAIVNISSVAAFYPRQGQGAYCASKAALEHLSRVLALELAADRIRVNVLRPGLTETDMGRVAVQTSVPPATGVIPLGRSARPEAIAEGVVFLAHAEHMTGQVLCIDGGQTINFAKLVPAEPGPAAVQD